jgi:hypothetical protein
MPTDIEVDGELACLSKKFESQRELAGWLKNRKTLAEAMRIESRNRRDDGRLISRAGVEHFVFAYLKLLNTSLLRNAAVTIELRVSSMARSDTTSEERVALVRDLLSSDMNVTKQTIVRALRYKCRAGDTLPSTDIEDQYANNEEDDNSAQES